MILKGVTMRYSIFHALVVSVTLSACGSMRPSDPPDALSCDIGRFSVDDIFSDRQIYLTPPGFDPTKEVERSFNVLSLSAGGQFGAYGAGFLYGWSKVGDQAIPGARNDIQVVTGVSTGAILATHAFLNRDKEIENKYREIYGEKIFRHRVLPEYLWSNSLFDTAGKDRLIQKNLKSEVIDDVAKQYGQGRYLYIGIVNLDSGKFHRIDMVKLAHDLQPKERRDLCYRAIIGASSAIPVAFPPKFIDGDMWVDGGARRHLFITQPPDDVIDPGVTRRLYSLVHGDLSLQKDNVKNGVLQIAGRTSEVFIDQGMKDSIRLQDQLAAECPKGTDCRDSGRRLFTTYYAAAASAADLCETKLHECTKNDAPTSDDMFCKPFMNCLADQGEKDGEAFANGTKAWLTLDDLCLGSDPECTQTHKTHRQIFQ